MQNLKWKYSKFLINENFQFSRNYVLKYLPSNLLLNSHKNISKWKGYNPTPLLKLNKLNKKLQLKNIFYKDESKRFHLKSFKALGGAYAVEEISKKNNWKIVQDVSSKNYRYIPQLTMAGYSILIKEISKQTNEYITHIFLQAGVGGLAAGLVAGIAKYFKKIPKIIIVEPDRADCVLQSIKNNKLKKIRIKRESIMGGMSCNEMSLVPWQILKKASNCCVSISDNNVAKTVASLKDKKFSKNSIIGGECATPGIIALIGICNDKKARKLISLNENSNVLVIGCEGNADVKLYKQLLSKGRK